MADNDTARSARTTRVVNNARAVTLDTHSPLSRLWVHEEGLPHLIEGLSAQLADADAAWLVRDLIEHHNLPPQVSATTATGAGPGEISEAIAARLRKWDVSVKPESVDALTADLSAAVFAAIAGDDSYGRTVVNLPDTAPPDEAPPEPVEPGADFVEPGPDVVHVNGAWALGVKRTRVADALVSIRQVGPDGRVVGAIRLDGPQAAADVIVRIAEAAGIDVVVARSDQPGDVVARIAALTPDTDESDELSPGATEADTSAHIDRVLSALMDAVMRTGWPRGDAAEMIAAGLKRHDPPIMLPAVEGRYGRWVVLDEPDAGVTRCRVEIPTTGDEEVDAMGIVRETLHHLDADTRRRVAGWVYDRWVTGG